MGWLTVSLGLVLLALPLIEAEQMCAQTQTFNRYREMKLIPDIDPDTQESTYASRTRLYNNVTIIYDYYDRYILCFSIRAPGDPEYCDGYQHRYGQDLRAIQYKLLWWEYITSVQWYDNTEEYWDYDSNGLIIEDLIITTNRRRIEYRSWGGRKEFKYTAYAGMAMLLHMTSSVDSSTSKDHKLTFYFACIPWFDFCYDESYTLADQVITAFKETSPISEVASVAEAYRHTLWPQLSQLGCNGYEDTEDDYYYGKDCCEMFYMLEQLAILDNIKTSMMNHEPKSLLRIDRFDSATLLAQARKSLDFHNLMTGIETNNRQITNNGRALGDYFTTLASYDQGIATKDQEFLTGKINSLTDGANDAANNVKDQIKQIVEASVALSVVSLAEAAVRLAAVIAENCNPLGIIFGGFDVDAIADAAERVAAAAANVAKTAALLVRLDSYLIHLREIKAKFADNTQQLASLAEVVEKFPQATGTQRVRLAQDFIRAYGDYTPKVTLAELVYCTELLQSVVGAACDIIDSNSGMWTQVASAGYSITTQDCMIVPAKIDQLGAYYDELYAFQYDLVDALAGIVRADLAKNKASEITATNQEDNYDSRVGAIGAAMVHINYQSLARQRCDELQYKWGGKLQTECKQIYIDNTEIPSIIANKEGTTESESTIWAYIPMSGTDPGKYIDVEALIRDKQFRFQLPFDDPQWMIDYGWLPSDYYTNANRREVSYMVQSMDVFLPGVRCSGQETWLGVDVVNAHPTRLFVEDAPDTFSVKSKVYAFSYRISSYTCASGNMQAFRVRDVNHREKPAHSICVESKGELKSDILPSLFSIWNLSLRDSCTLVRHPLDYEPLITVRIDRKEILQSGLDMCWPTGSRCTGYCQPGKLSYTCY